MGTPALWLSIAQLASDAAPGGPAEVPSDDLDRAQERIGEEKHPGHSICELGTDLQIGCCAARITVRSAGNESRSQYFQKAWRTGFENATALLATFILMPLSGHEPFPLTAFYRRISASNAGRDL